MLERKHEKLICAATFAKRVSRYLAFALLLVSIALFIGVAGYHWIAGLKWIDSLLNASMILGGMGPVDTLTTDGAKIFASIYALFSGLMFIAVMGIIFTPIMHRVLHTFHMEDKDRK
jgi:hypothetical protein